MKINIIHVIKNAFTVSSTPSPKAGSFESLKHFCQSKLITDVCMEGDDDARVIPSTPPPPGGTVVALQHDEVSVALDSHADDERIHLGTSEGEDEKVEEPKEMQVDDEVGPAEGEGNRSPIELQNASVADASAETIPAYQDHENDLHPPDDVVESTNLPPTPPAKREPTRESSAQPSIQPVPPLGGHDNSSLVSDTPGEKSPVSTAHRRSLTISKGHIVSVVLISTALETIAASKEAKRSPPLRDSTHTALEMIRSNQAGDHPREIFEPLRLACETRNEKLMIASLDCISKLISYSFFAESDPQPPVVVHSPPPSPRHPNRNSGANTSQSIITQPSLVDLVAHTITACHTETTPETVSLQIVKALLSLVLSPTILVHHSSLLKAVRTVYNVFLLSTDPVNQMVAQGGLTQIVHHVFTRCRTVRGSRSSHDPVMPSPGSQDTPFSSARDSSVMTAMSESQHTSFSNDSHTDVEPSSVHEMPVSLPPPSDPIETNGEEDKSNRGRNDSPAARPSQITLYAIHPSVLRAVIHMLCYQTVLRSD